MNTVAQPSLRVGHGTLLWIVFTAVFLTVVYICIRALRK